MAASNSTVGIVGMGMQTSLGGATQAAAAFRAGLSRTVELDGWPVIDEPWEEPLLLLGHSCGGVTEGFQGEGRLLRLVDRAMADLRLSLPTDDRDPARTGVFVVLPRPQAGRPGFLRDPEQVAKLATRIHDVSRIPGDPELVHHFAEGRVGVVSALTEAIRTLGEGRMDRVFLIAVDSLLDSGFLGHLVSRFRVKSIDNPTGLAPGEAACIICLEVPDSAREGTLLGKLHLPARTEVENTREDDAEDLPPQTGREMSQALVGAIEGASVQAGEIGDFYSDANGEVYRAHELGGALHHLNRRVPVSSWRSSFPATSFGDTGAASGLLQVCLATRSFVRRYARGPCALLALASDGRARGGLLLEEARNG